MCLSVEMITITNQDKELVLNKIGSCESIKIKVNSLNEVLIENQIGSNKSYFIELKNNVFTLFGVENLQFSNHKLCIQESVRQICAPEFDYIHSVLEGVDILMAGNEVTVKLIGSKIKYDIYHSPLTTQSTSSYPDPVEILVDNIHSKISKKNSRHVTVRFSGGVDSTALLLIAIELLGKANVLALTWTNNSGSAHMDKSHAFDFCKKVGVKNLQLDFSEDYFFRKFNSKILPIIKPGYILEKFYFRESELIKAHFPECNLILDGHGGDHVFLDPVPVEILKTIFQEKGLKGLSNAVRNFRLLYGSSISRHIFTRAKSAAFRKRNTQSYFMGEAFSIAKSSLAKKEFLNDRITYLREAVFHNSTNPFHPELIEVFHPFTTEDMIAYGANLDPSALFDDCATRIPFRKAMHERYGENNLRKDKGHITGAYQKALAENSKYIEEIVSGGILVKNKYLNFEKFKSSMQLHSLGVNGCDPVLLKIVLFEMIGNHCRETNEKRVLL